MLFTDKTQTDAIAASLVDWWKMAGAVYSHDETAVDWLAPEEHELEFLTISSRQETRLVSTQPIVERPAIASAAWPDNIAGLHHAIANGHLLPSNKYGGKSASPAGNVNAQLMIIGDLPDVEEVDAGSMGAGALGELLIKMVAAIGFELGNCYLTALATTRPATGELPDDDYDLLAKFALHQIELVNPQSILILGSATCRALLGADLIAARQNLPDINHIVGNKAATPTFHPRTLLARPTLKAKAWQDLQMLAKKDAL